WKNVIRWYGETPIAPAEYQKWTSIVNDIHAKGRKVRFWNTPETELFWETALQVGIDLINTDQLQKLNRFLDRRSENDTKSSLRLDDF
ncbi:MAG: hypothetical protein JXR73_19765, partial [Candidatus Omnitrophica bacterium]|nr:hypothetical protein [Candidatus Omnitrophota bacterium]